MYPKICAGRLAAGRSLACIAEPKAHGMAHEMGTMVVVRRRIPVGAYRVDVLAKKLVKLRYDYRHTLALETPRSIQHSPPQGFLNISDAVAPSHRGVG